MFNNRLSDWYGIDTKKDLQIDTFCTRPFDTVLIDKQGSCFVCECAAWLPQSVGNLHVRSFDEIIQSKNRAALQDSILDKSYRFCNNSQCSYLLYQKKSGTPWKKDTPINLIKNIRLAIDDSCNLSCPSCRTRIIFEKDKSRLRKRYSLADKIIDYCANSKHPINIHVGSDGDPFASLVYRYFIKKIRHLPNVRFTIQTNGLLIAKMYKRFEELFDKLDVLNISMDGATKETYEQLRRGGSYEKIIENLQTVKELRGKYKFKFILHCVVQTENYRDMIPMIRLAEKYGAERLWFNRITNWNTFQNFKDMDVLDKNNKNYTDCVAVIEKIKNIKSSVIVAMPTMLGHD